VKAPGILYRVSFLVFVNSLFIVLTVLVVSTENNQARIERLIRYRFDFISEYFHARLGDLSPAPGDSAAARIDNRALAGVFADASRYMKGLAGLAVLTPTDTGGQYGVEGLAFRQDIDGYDPQIWRRLTSDLDRDNLSQAAIHVGPTFETAPGKLKTIYIPADQKAGGKVLAITFAPHEIIGADYGYTSTIVILILCITLITLLIINLLFRNFVRPLQHLVQGMEKTARGATLIKIEDVTNDEIGRVAVAFNTMSASLGEKRQQLTTSNERLMVLNQRLTETLDELSKANASVAESEAFLARLIENSPYPVIATDLPGKILVFSRAAMATFDIRVDEAIGRDLREFFPFTPDKLLPGDTRDASVTQDEMICRKPDGESFPALVCRVPIREHAAHVSAYLFIIRDISESAGFQEMMISIDRMATRGVMAGEIAHEINNYLAIILGNVELLPLLLSKGKMDKVEQKLEVLRNTVTKIQRFSEGLMGYGNEAAVFEPGDLNQLIENLVAFLKPQNRYDGIAFSLSLSPRLPLVEFDGSQLQQMMVNLLNNAADALRERPDNRRINIATGASADSQTVRMTITDNAGGLPEDLRETIFERRYSGKRRGRGFGLVIVKRIIDKHGGRVGYDSRPGDGATFTITLPVKAATVTQESAAASAQVTT
jgi:PAS domain S-box-containing protein